EPRAPERIEEVRHFAPVARTMVVGLRGGESVQSLAEKRQSGNARRILRRIRKIRLSRARRSHVHSESTPEQSRSVFAVVVARRVRETDDHVRLSEVAQVAGEPARPGPGL